MTGTLALARALPKERKLYSVAAVVVSLLLAVGLAPAKAIDQVKTVVALGDSADSMVFRFAAWKTSLPMLANHALVGTGPGTFGATYTPYRSAAAGLPRLFVDYLHNDYLQYGAEMGLAAMVALAGVFLLTMWRLIRHGVLGADRPEFPLVVGTLGAVAAFAGAVFYSFERA
jgi:O-antigen ligase